MPRQATVIPRAAVRIAVLYQRNVVQAVARRDADVAAGRTVSHEPVGAALALLEGKTDA